MSATTRNTAVVAVFAALAALVVLVAVRAGGAETASVADRHRLVIGVKDDQPGLGLRGKDGSYAGFDVDVAYYVAGRLGVGADDVTFRAVRSDERERVLRDGSVDMVIATYSITPERAAEITFAGPYYVTHQDILIREGDASIGNVRDLRGKRLCQVAGSNSWRRVTEERRVAATLVPARSYSECVAMLVGRGVDAVSTDDLILAGFATVNEPGVKMLKKPFTNERYGIGLKKGDLKGCEAVNRILTEMYQNGAAKTLLNQWFGSVDFNIATTVPPFEGCA
ncbi:MULTISPECIES: glutamate ABC transporter substrate-binding protein [Actinomadura]|uniref:Glutamate ABC transporter substrate-binding protein n=2 Tax=Actinomadura yumaensis TaxID=111807 RepID=A0ABW2CLT5_9ACTN|nr:glutamate ABC transporter substrate-binding protein [Actinomadura sp. J1-007]MWK40649.1 transporter substrate-binding domain-containing protein [Actinomadura sp. J1-007]